MKDIDHIAIAVRNIEVSENLFSKLLGTRPLGREIVTSENVIVSFFKVGAIRIELIQSLKKGSSIDKFIDSKGEGLHHIAFKTENIERSINVLNSEGFGIIGDGVKKGSGSKKICFLNPKQTNRILIELCE